MVNYFTINSQLVKDQVFLINNGYITFEEVLPIFNLRDVVKTKLEEKENER